MYDYFLFIFVFIVSLLITQSYLTSFIVAALITLIFYVITYNRASGHILERFDGGRDDRKRKEKTRSSGSRRSKKKARLQHKIKDKLKTNDPPLGDMHSGLNKDGKYNLDWNGTMFNNYKNLSPKQIKALDKDTRELIDTQKQLMGTLRDMGPVLEQGKSILQVFDTFFQKNNNLGDLEYYQEKFKESN